MSGEEDRRWQPFSLSGLGKWRLRELSVVPVDPHPLNLRHISLAEVRSDWQAQQWTGLAQVSSD